MTWKTDVRALVAALALGVSIVGCGDTVSPRSPTPSARASLDKGGNNQGDQDDDDQGDDDTIYDQTDFLGNPLVSEVTITKANHALYNKTQFWDGRADTLEAQAALPIVNPVEMGRPTLDAAVAEVAGIEEYRQAFALFHEQELSYAEIGAALDCPVGTVKTWVHRARRELIERLRERGVVFPGLNRGGEPTCTASSLKCG